MDAFGFTDRDLIKIDVEGHEAQVIEGAKKTLEASKPVIVVETEQRHIGQTPIENVFQNFFDLGYRGMFLSDEKVIDIDDFQYEKHQKPYLENVFSENYINNFIFVYNSK